MAEWEDRPIPVEVKAGDKKAFCTCRKSANAPFCDGSHAGSGQRPCVVEFDEDKTIHACRCLRSANGIYCDGSHSRG